MCETPNDGKYRGACLDNSPVNAITSIERRDTLVSGGVVLLPIHFCLCSPLSFLCCRLATLLPLLPRLFMISGYLVCWKCFFFSFGKYSRAARGHGHLIIMSLVSSPLFPHKCNQQCNRAKHGLRSCTPPAVAFFIPPMKRVLRCCGVSYFSATLAYNIH